jgi:cholesterol transport system auxiliary component
VTRLAAALALTALAGCGGGLFQTKVAPPTTYLLSAGAQGELPAAAAPLALAVLKPRVRAGLGSERIALLYPDRRLEYYARARWAGPLDEVLQDLAVAVFHNRAGFSSVAAEASAFGGAYWLELEVSDFQAEYATPDALPVVHVHLLARVGSAAERRVLGSAETDVRQGATENRMSAIVAAYELAADRALADIAVRVATLNSSVAR